MKTYGVLWRVVVSGLLIGVMSYFIMSKLNNSVAVFIIGVGTGYLMCFVHWGTDRLLKVNARRQGAS